MIGKYKIAALCVSRIYDDSTHELVTELNKNITEKGWRLLVYHTCSDLYWDSASEKGESSVFDLIDMRKIDALIFADNMLKNKQIVYDLIDKAMIFDTPVISIGGNYSDVINIDFDYKSGFEDVVRHVVEYHGLRRLHFMAGTRGNTFSEERIEVFAKVLEENHIEFDRSTMLSYGDFWRDPTVAAVKELLARSDELPQAIICANDTMAIEVCNTLSNAGIKVPDEICVTGFDGIMEINFSTPRITSSICCYGDITRKISGLLSLNKEDLLKEAHYEIKSRLVISESCGCKSSGIISVSNHLSDLENRFSRYKDEEKALYEIGVRILAGKNLKTAANELSSPIIYNMRCMLRKEVINETINPLENDYSGNFGEELCVFYDSDASKPYVPYEIDASAVMPGLEVALDSGYPIILTALNFLNVPLGYTTFSFQSYDICNYEKIPQVVNALNNSIGGYRNLRYQQYITRQVQLLSEYDQLTGLYTRGGSQNAYNTLIDKLAQQDRPITVIMVDLDGLKSINDGYGHNEGDYAIKATASALKNSCPPNSVCIRMGGDEMAAFLSSTQPLDDIKQEIAARLRSVNRTSRKPYPITASVGVYRSPEGEGIPSFEDLIKAADEIMYVEKAEHRRLRAEQKQQ